MSHDSPDTELAQSSSQAAQEPQAVTGPSGRADLSSQLPALVAKLETLSTSPEVTAQALSTIVDLQLKVLDRQAAMDFAAALSRFNRIKQTIGHNRTGEGPGGARFGYTDFPKMVREVQPWLDECGLSFSHRNDQPTLDDEGYPAGVMVYCTLHHTSGHKEEHPFYAVADKRLKGKLSPSQLIQQAITYGKRQTLSMALGLATAEDVQDDDTHPETPVEYITDEQLSQLRDLVEQWEPTDQQKKYLLQWAKVDDLENLPASKFEKVRDKLQEKIAGKGDQEVHI